MLTLVDIEEICTSDPGISKIFITDPTNVTEANLNPVGLNPGQVAPIPIFPPEIYEIRYRQYTAGLKTKSSTGPGGDYEELELTFLLPKRRASVEHLKRNVINRHVAVFAYNTVGDQIAIPYAKVNWNFDSGKKLGDDEAYEIKVTGVSLLNDFVSLPANENPIGEDTPIPGDTTIVSSTPVGNGGVTVVADCCITINTDILAYVPEPSGNTANLNRIVTASDNNKYLIDNNGVAIRLGIEIEKARITTLGDTFSLPSHWYITDPNDSLLVSRNGVLCKAVDTITDINQYICTGSDITIGTDWPLTSGEFIDVWRIK